MARVLFLVAAVWLVAVGLLAARPAQEAATGGALPLRALELKDEGYVGSQACQECHADNHASWHASFHRTMTQQPSSTSIRAPFSGMTPTLEGRAFELTRVDEAYYATPLAPDGRALGPRARVALVTGSHHYQIYWLATPSGALEQLPLVWHLGEARWVPRKSMFLQPPGRTGPETDRWQQVCIKCHATNGTPSHELDGATRVAELGIACEACHGPGAQHVAWRRETHAETAAEPANGLVDPSELEPARSAEICGQCHGIHLFGDDVARERWTREGFDYRPGDVLAATRRLLRGRAEANDSALRAYLERHPATRGELYWSDGEVRVSGREYNGLLESPCFQRGSGERRMTCVSCHELHVSEERVERGWADDQLKLGMEGPAACLGCHAAYSSAEALRTHTHHAPTSSGSDCLNCHMPYTTYGLTKAIRSHTITSPNASATLATNRPNACNLCHLDQSLGWTATQLASWYGQTPPELDADRASVAESVRWTLTGDAGLRALAAASLGWPPARAVSGTGWMPYLLSTLLLDEYDAVRWIATRTLRLEPRYAGFALDPCAALEQQRNHVRATVLTDWLRDSLQARPEQRAAVLVQPDGKLDDPGFDRLFKQRDNRPVRLSE
jgi:hypothetical protein